MQRKNHTFYRLLGELNAVKSSDSKNIENLYRYLFAIPVEKFIFYLSMYNKIRGFQK